MAFLKESFVAAETVVELGHAIERELDGEQAQARLLERLPNLLDRPVFEVPVAGDVDLLDAVVTDELPTDGPELLAQERFAAGQVEVLDVPELLGQVDDLLEGKIVAVG